MTRLRFRQFGFNVTFKISPCQAVFIMDISLTAPYVTLLCRLEISEVLWIRVFLTVRGLASGEILQHHHYPAVILLGCPFPLGQLTGSSTKSPSVHYIIGLITYKAYIAMKQWSLSLPNLLKEHCWLKASLWSRIDGENKGSQAAPNLFCLCGSSLNNNGKQWLCKPLMCEMFWSGCKSLLQSWELSLEKRNCVERWSELMNIFFFLLNTLS